MSLSIGFDHSSWNDWHSNDPIRNKREASHVSEHYKNTTCEVLKIPLTKHVWTCLNEFWPKMTIHLPLVDNPLLRMNKVAQRSTKTFRFQPNKANKSAYQNSFVQKIFLRDEKKSLKSRWPWHQQQSTNLPTTNCFHRSSSTTASKVGNWENFLS